MVVSLGIVALVLSIAIFVTAIFIGKSSNFNEIKNEKDCTDAFVKDSSKYEEGGECHIWDGSQCRKGKFENKTCKSQGKILPLVLLVVSVLLLFFGMYKLFVGGQSE